IYAVYHALTSPKTFLASVFENLGLERLELDCLEWTGEAFTGWNRDEVHAFLVAGGYAEAVVFTAGNQLVPSNELLYKKALVLEPGRFESVDRLYLDLIEDTLAHMAREELEESKGGLGLFCLSFADHTSDKEISSILEQVVNLRQLGHGVMLFRSQELY